jgi:hypothetical protein
MPCNRDIFTLPYLFEVAQSTVNSVIKYGSGETQKWDNRDKWAVKTMEIRTFENTKKNTK